MTVSLSRELDDLKTFEEGTEKPASPRLSSLGAAIGLYTSIEFADRESSRGRAKIDAMFDGAPPYDSTKLRAMGQGNRCNINFGEGQRHLDAAQAGYVDLLTSTEHLVDVKTEEAGEDSTLQKDEADAVLNEEITNTIRGWNEFAPRILTLSTEFLKHGIGVSYFISATNWRFYSTGLADFKFPRNVRATEDAIDVSFARQPYSVPELFSFIENPDAATAEGWNVEQARKTLMGATRTKNDRSCMDWEEWQRQYKNGDTYSSEMQVKSVPLVHTWVKENDGSLSHYIWDESIYATYNKEETSFSGSDFLYRQENVHPNSQRAFTLFSYGVGNNGTYHSVRGLGQRIFSQVQYLNRLQCQAADAAAVSGGLLLQPNSMEDLRDIALQTYGPYNILRPNVNLVDGRTVPDLTRNMVPIISDLRQQLADTSDFYSTARAAQGSPYRNTLQVRAELESATRLSSANLALFYTALDRLLRECTRRLITGPMSDPEVKNFYERCEKRGLTKEQIRSVDHSATKAARAIGAGNPAARVAVLDQLNQERPFMDEEGNRRLTFDRVAARIGYDGASKYVVRGSKPRGTNEQSLANLENSLLNLGQAVPVLSAQFHGTHLEIHIPIAQDLISRILGGEIDANENIGVIAAMSSHVSGHAEGVASDHNQQNLVSVALDVSNKLRQIVENTERSLQAQNNSPDQEGAPSKADELARIAQVKEDILRSEADLKMTIIREKAEQEQRLKDFAAAAEAQRNANQAILRDLST